MQVLKNTLLLLFGTGVLIGFAYSRVIKKTYKEVQILPIKKLPAKDSDPPDEPMSASYKLGQMEERALARGTSETEIIPIRDDLSQKTRMQLMDLCFGLGKSCTRSEECCTLQCLKKSKICYL